MLTPQQEAAMRQALTQDALKQMLWYDPETGVFRWRHSKRRGQIKPWSLAGSPCSRGYLQTQIDGKAYLNHRLAWLYMTGGWPTDMIDHINQIKSDNSWSNLREATNAQNQWNVDIKASSQIGVKGVQKQYGKYCPIIKVNGVIHRLGRFSTLAEAESVVTEYRRKLHGEFAKQ